MCGITGLFGNQAEQNTLDSMLEVAQRRGPEETTSVEVKGGLLGHTLLAFVNEGNNPQPLQEEGATMIYNGEVYNWKSLNHQYNLKAKNDTETLLRGFKQYGEEFLKQVDGQFAFIAQIEEEGNIQTYVARDKYGISPLVFGNNKEGELVIASTPEAVKRARVQTVKTVPAGTSGCVKGNDLDLSYWFELPKVSLENQRQKNPEDIVRKATQQVVTRIPEQTEILYTAMGGIDSQFVTTTVARNTSGNFGGAITVVPWDPNDPNNMTLGDYHEAKASVEILEDEGIKINHYVVQLDPGYIDSTLDRVLKVLGPDYFNACCGLAEDLVATTAKKYGGKAIMTAGGPDEAGRSYKPWTQMHRNDLESGFHAVCDQFASAEGVRAGLVFGEHGLENRVPLSHLIEDSQYWTADQKQQIEDWGDGNPFSIQMKDKIAWRQGLEGLLPEKSLNKPKETIHGASGSKPAVYHVAKNDAQFQTEREEFIEDMKQYGWDLLVHSDLNDLDSNNKITEGQLYVAWRWSKLEPEDFTRGLSGRYVRDTHSTSLTDKIAQPVCYDWLPAESAR